MKRILTSSLLLMAFSAFVAFVPQVEAQSSFKVLIDEGHSEWLVSGNAQKLIQDLEDRGYVVDTSSGTITESLLSSYDVFLIGIAWTSFSSSEIDAVENYVSGGGGLCLLGLGWSWVDYHPESTINDYPMNEIASRFGAFFNPDIIYDPTDHTTEPGSAIFHEPFIHPHPVTNGVSSIGATEMFIGSITADTGTILITGDNDSYGGYHESPYPDPGMFPPMLAAIFHGHGRVIVMSHEGFFNDDHIDEYNNKQLGLRIVDWFTQEYLPMDKSAVIVDPLYYEHPNDNLISRIYDYLEYAGYDVSVTKSTDVTIEWLKTGLKHGVVFWRGHGTPISSLVTYEEVTPETETKYADDVSNGRVFSTRPKDANYDCWGFTADFIRHYYENNRFRYSLIYVEACYGLAYNYMAQAFVECVAGSFVGYEGRAWAGPDLLPWSADAHAEKFFADACLSGYNVEQAVDDIHDWWDPFCSLDWHGDGNLKLLSETADMSALSVSAFSPVDILVTTPNGLRVGYDPAIDSVVNEVLGAIYSGPGTEPQFIIIPSPMLGVYIIDRHGTGTGAYTITINSVGSDGSIVQSDSWSGIAFPDATDRGSVQMFEDGTFAEAPHSVIPEVPWGTVTALVAMMIALVAYIIVPKKRRKQGHFTSAQAQTTKICAQSYNLRNTKNYESHLKLSSSIRTSFSFLISK